MMPRYGNIDMSHEAIARLNLHMGLTPKLAADGWCDIETAPKNGTEVELRVVHIEAAYEDDAEAEGWIDACRGHWTDFNGGGWTWHGLYGAICQWRPIERADRRTEG